ncbi:MAG TPA: helix-turn-helix domain-containing protein [Micromonosporaceae bacterium]|jgi:DNA-binding transcriptional ArsR family regulator
MSSLGDVPSSVHQMRALAHPTRTRILALLRDRPSMTATECAGILHLTPKTCSYHLQTLASSGLIREIPTSGRNRPWELVPDAVTPPPPPATKSVRTRREESILEHAARSVASAPVEWSEAVTLHMRVATMNPAEVAAWCDEVERVTSRHVRRAAIPDLAGRESVRLVFVGYPSELERS